MAEEKLTNRQKMEKRRAHCYGVIYGHRIYQDPFNRDDPNATLLRLDPDDVLHKTPWSKMPTPEQLLAAL